MRSSNLETVYTKAGNAYRKWEDAVFQNINESVLEKTPTVSPTGSVCLKICQTKSTFFSKYCVKHDGTALI